MVAVTDDLYKSLEDHCHDNNNEDVELEARYTRFTY